MKDNKLLFLAIIVFIIIILLGIVLEQKYEKILLKSPKPSAEVTFQDSNNELTYIKEYQTGVIYVKFKEGYDIVEKQNVENLINQIKSKNSNLAEVLDIKKIFNARPDLKNYEVKKQIGLDRWVRINLPENVDTIVEANKWSSLSEIELAEPVSKSRFTLEEIPLEPDETIPRGGSTQIIPNDPLFISQWHHKNTGRNPEIPSPTPDADIDSPEAWYIEKGNIIVGNPDSAVKWFHEDLVDNIWRNLGEYLDRDGDTLEWSASQNRYVFDSGDINNIDDDNNGFTDDFIGWDFKNNDNDPFIPCGPPYPCSPNWEHGTFTTGVIAAKPNNNIGVAGVCWNCKIIATAGFDDVNEIEYDIDNGAKVISMSLYGESSGIWADILNYAISRNILLVTAAGNRDGVWEVNHLCNNENVLCVTASTQQDKLKESSNFGPKTDIGAPANYVYTTNNDATTKYSKHGATSIATPIVAGVGALILSYNPALSPKEVISIIQSSVDPFVEPTVYFGTGRINAFNALRLTQRTLQTGSYPIAIIDGTQTRVTSNILNIFGTARSSRFSDYKIYLGTEIYPQSWTLLSHQTTQNDGLLYSIDLLTLSPGNYQVKLVVTDIYGQEAFDTFSFERNLHIQLTGWPILTQSGEYLEASPTITDFNGDRNMEIIALGQWTWVYVYNYDGSTYPCWPIAGGFPGFWTSPAVGDINNDATPEIVVGTRSTNIGSNLIVYDEDGSIHNGWPITLTTSGVNTPSLGDIDNDGLLEIVVGSGNNLYVFNEDRTYVNGWPIVSLSNRLYPQTPIADIDNDGSLDIVASLEDGWLYVFRANGSLLPGWPIQNNVGALMSPVVADIDGDKLLEIIVGSRDFEVISNNKLFIYGYNGLIKSGWPKTISEPPISTLAVADLNNDDLPEIIVVTYINQLSNKIYVINSDGSILTGWPKTINGFIGSPVIADVDNDNNLEIVFTATNYKLYALNEDASDVNGWPISTSEIFYSAPIIEDINNDGNLEIVALNYGPYIYAWELNGRANQFTGWPEFGKDGKNTGYYPSVNKQRNPSYEIDSGIDYYPNWNQEDNISNNNKPDGYVTSGSGLLDNVIKYQGSKSLKIQVTNDRGYSYQDIPVDYNKRYRVSGYIKTDCNDNNCYGTIISECENINHQPIWDYSNCKLNINPIDIRRLYNDNDWTYIEFDVENNRQDARFLRVLCYNTPGPNPVGSGIVWCDSFNVIEIPRGGGIGSPLFLKNIPQEGLIK